MADEPRLSFTEHLRELRTRLRNAVIALIVAWALCFWASDLLFALLARPLVLIWNEQGLGKAEMNFGSLTEPFWVYFEISLWAAVFVSSPIIFHQLWKFVAPGLYQKEKRIAIPFAVCSALCFIGGALFCYFLVLPAAYRFLMSYTSESLGRYREAFGFLDIDAAGGALGVKPTLFMRQYLDLSMRFLLGFGVVFELPMLIFFLSWAGLVTHRSLWRFNKYAIVISFIVGAILTPGPDIVSQLLMACPMVVLYNLSIIIAFVVTKRRERRAAAGDAGEPPPE